MKSLNSPLVISTWDFGAEANRVAWKILMSRENPLDAVERAINAIEKDPGVTSVGYGGIPNADGFTELDAAIMSGPNHKAGAAATGVGEQTMMFCGSFLVVENMRRGMSPQQACEATIKRMISKRQKKWVGFIALDKEGQYGAASLGKEFPFAIYCKKGELIQKSRIQE